MPEIKMISAEESSAFFDFDCALRDFKEGRVVDLDFALNNPPPEEKKESGEVGK